MTTRALRSRLLARAAIVVGGAALGAASGAAIADETCQSPYMAKITGQEEYAYVWTLGIEAWATAPRSW